MASIRQRRVFVGVYLLALAICVHAIAVTAGGRRAQQYTFSLPTSTQAAIAASKHLTEMHLPDCRSGQKCRQDALSSPIETDDFIQADGLRLRDSRGELFFVQGMNYWSCMTMASSRQAGGDPKRLKAELDQLANVGINTIRIMAAVEGAESRQPNRIYPSLQPRPGEWDERVFQGLDTCIAEVGKRGIRVIMTMGNTWQWSGGISQQVAWADGEQAIPYPPAWDLSLPPQRTDGRPGWGNYTQDKYEPYMAYQERFYTDKTAQDIYRAHLDKVMSRQNTQTKRRYSEDPTILAWEPLNEPQKADTGPAATEAMIAWHHSTSDYIKSKAPRQMTTTGYEAKLGERHFKQLHDHPAIDFACAHLWVQNWNQYDMLDRTEASLDHAKAFAKGFVRDADTWSAEIGKPVLLEEFGMARDNWHNDVGAGQYQYDTDAPTTHRDSYFAMLYSQVRQSFARNVAGHEGSAAIGIMPWSYGGLYRSATQEFTKYKIILAGDPPQERE